MTAPSFALHDLGWHDFQHLCHTVLREVLGQTVVCFLDGNDGGRDGGFSGSWTPTSGTPLEGEFVVQCKHTARPNAALSLTQLKDELEKIGELVDAGRCDIYVLMTNAGLTGRTEQRIVAEIRERGVKHVLVLGATWLNQTIAESPRLRRLVPRLYGLGDLTQILDERSYRQARAVLDAMRTDLAKLVLTGTYDRAVRAVTDNRFVLLVGAPATGKTTIAAQLALGASDEYGATVVKLDTIGDLQSRWNPDERQMFWLDDAFGATQFDPSSANQWTIAVPRILAAIAAGAHFVFTSRDYVLRAARWHLKPGSFPLLNESQVVVDVGDLTRDERRQILYNHLRHGRQSNTFIAIAKAHLELAAAHPGFTPELARRLSDPLFTNKVRPELAGSIEAFFGRPSMFLNDVIAGLDADARAALGLIFISHNWVPSPIHLTDRADDLLSRLGSDLGGVTKALDSLEGSLVQNILRDGSSGWVFAHPTMVDAYADLLRTPELIHHLIVGFPSDVLFSEVTCGDVGLQGAVVVPTSLYEGVLDRLDEPLPPGDHQERWRANDRRTAFLANRCNKRFLTMWVERNADQLNRLAEPSLLLEVAVENNLVAKLHQFGLFPEELRAKFADEVIYYASAGTDPAGLWDEDLQSVLYESERTALRKAIRDQLLGDPFTAVSNCTEGWESWTNADAEAAVEPLRTLVHVLPEYFPGDTWVTDAAEMLNENLDQWVGENSREPDRFPDQAWDENRSWNRPASTTKRQPMVSHTTSPRVPPRSVFDDLLDGRHP